MLENKDGLACAAGPWEDGAPPKVGGVLFLVDTHDFEEKHEFSFDDFWIVYWVPMYNEFRSKATGLIFENDIRRHARIKPAAKW